MITRELDLEVQRVHLASPLGEAAQAICHLRGLNPYDYPIVMVAGISHLANWQRVVAELMLMHTALPPSR